MSLIDLCERGYIPDRFARMGMRALIAKRLVDEAADDGEFRSRRFNAFLEELRSGPIAIETAAGGQRHDRLPAEFYRLHLGPKLKHSCCLYPAGNETLESAEDLMLTHYLERLGVGEDMRVLDLGCGWGSLSMWLASRFTRTEVVGLSNSNSQREFIRERSRERGLDNLTVLSGDLADFDMPQAVLGRGFDRVISIEMFEHMKNYGLLLNKVARWMKPDARLFVQLFAHKLLAYPFQDKREDDWVSRHFLSGGTMPSENLLLHFQDDLRLVKHWWIGGQHYQKTAEHWLERMDAARRPIMDVFCKAYGDGDAARWFQRWRMFYMAVAELFGYARGNEWGVGHYLFEKRER